MTQITPKTAAERDALLAAAQAAGLDASRTAKDFFVAGGRVTPAQLAALTAEAEQEAQARAEAFEAAEAIRAEVELSEGDLEDQLAAALEEPAPVAEVVVVDGELVEVVAPAEEAQPTKSTRGVIKYGPPCGGDLAHLSLATSEEAKNPLMHLRVDAQTTYKTKAEAAAAGKASGQAFLAFLAVDADLETAWVVATVGDTGALEIDGQPVTAELLTGADADAARAKLDGKRLKEKSQWRVQAA